MTPDAADGGLVGGITVPYRVRFDECGPDGLVRSASLLRYAQDIAWVHSDALGFTREWYDARGMAWVVRAAELAVQAPIRSGVTLLVSTAVVGFRRVWSRRRTVARFEDGTPAFWGHTDFVMLDTVRGMPARVPDDLPARFAVPPGTFEPGRVTLAQTPPDAVLRRSAVEARDIDPMGHVNNTVYLDYLEEAVLAGGPAAVTVLATIPRRIRLEYIVAAGPAEELVGAAWPIAAAADGAEDDAIARWAWRLADATDRELARGLVIPGVPGV